MLKPKYKRVLVKISGEAMQGKDRSIIDFELLSHIAEALVKSAAVGCEVAVVVGAGNIWRGVKQGAGMDRCRADHMGMIATVINAIAIKDMVIRKGGDAVVMTPVSMTEFAEQYVVEKALRHMAAGRVVILGCGTGNPYFSTDTGAVLRAAELGAEIVLMAKNIDGIYDKDPAKFSDAHKFDRVSYDEILCRKLTAYDLTATAFCLTNKQKTYAFGLRDPMNIYRAVMGEDIGTETY